VAFPQAGGGPGSDPPPDPAQGGAGDGDRLYRHGRHLWPARRGRIWVVALRPALQSGAELLRIPAARSPVSLPLDGHRSSAAGCVLPGDRRGLGPHRGGVRLHRHRPFGGLPHRLGLRLHRGLVGSSPVPHYGRHLLLPLYDIGHRPGGGDRHWHHAYDRCHRLRVRAHVFPHHPGRGASGAGANVRGSGPGGGGARAAGTSPPIR